MSNTQTTASKPPAPDVKAATGTVSNDPPTAKTIQVGHIWLDALTDLPGKKLTDVLVATPRDKVYGPDGARINNQHAWLIEYTPAYRHFKITWVPPGREKPEQESYHHEHHIKRWDKA